MKFDDQARRYLYGEEFSNGGFFSVPRQPIVGRNELLVRIAKDKRVLHVGCADHTPLISEKRQLGNYLHDLLSASAHRLIGMDTNETALAEMRALGIDDLYSPESLPAGVSFDVVLVPDVIEHIPDVNRFLESLLVHDAPIVVTTPNAFRLRNRRCWEAEFVNTDHRYWFSPYTLARSLVESGFEPTHFWYTDFGDSWRSRVRHPREALLRRRYPLCRDGLAIQAVPRHE